MIIFEGIRLLNNVSMIKFSNDKTKNSIEIPIGSDIAKHISLYLSKISVPNVSSVERGNDEPSD